MKRYIVCLIYCNFDNIAFRWKDILFVSFIVIYKAFKWIFDQHVSFWYLSHISKYLKSIDCSWWCSRAGHINSGLSLHLYIHTLCMQTAKDLVSLHIYKAWLIPNFLTLQWVLVPNQIYWLIWFILVTSYNLVSLILNIQRINRMQFYNNDNVPM